MNLGSRSERQEAHTKRVLFLNNYPMKAACQLVEDGEYPGQHLWGWWELRDTWEWLIPRHTFASIAARFERLSKPLSRLMPLSGDILQELYVLAHVRKCDVIYAADQQSAALLCLLRRLGVLRKPVVVMVHNGPRSRWTRYWMSGADRLLTLSPSIRDKLQTQLSIPHESLILMPWGPSLDSPVYKRVARSAGARHDFVAAGKTNRDYSSLVRVAVSERMNGVIFEAGTEVRFCDGKRSDRKRNASYLDVLAELVISNCSIIPLDDVNRLSGLTEAADAMALGVPIVATASDTFPYFDGKYVTPVDTSDDMQLLRAIRLVSPATSQRDVLVARYNMANYAAELLRVVNGLCS